MLVVLLKSIKIDVGSQGDCSLTAPNRPNNDFRFPRHMLKTTCNLQSSELASLFFLNINSTFSYSLSSKDICSSSPFSSTLKIII